MIGFNTMIQQYYIPFLSLVLIMLLSGCATTQFVPLPNEENQVIPNTSKLTSKKDSLIINVGPASSSYRLSNKLTIIEMTIVNPTGSSITYYPKEFLLFDHYNQQYHPLERDALSDFSSSSRHVYPHYSYGFGYHHGYYRHHYGFHHYPHYYPHGYTYRRSYHGLISYALPLRPITIHPHSSVSGYLYYPVARNSLESMTLHITRFTRRPSGPEDTPPEISYRFHFDALK